jgi:hypothetical protein
MTRLSGRVILLDVVLVVDPEIEPDGLVLAVLSELAFITGAETKAGTYRGIESSAHAPVRRRAAEVAQPSVRLGVPTSLLTFMSISQMTKSVVESS